MNKIFTYLSEARTELVKVNWPKPRQAFKLTMVVGVFSLVFAALIGALDYSFTLILQKIILKG